MIYDETLSDDEWRAANFPQDVLHSAARMGVVASATALIKYAEKFGVDGIAESAIMLGQSDYRKVERELRKLPQPVVKRRGPRRARAV